MAKYKPSNEQTMGEALSLFLERYRLRRGFDDAMILKAWDDVLGPSITRQTTSKVRIRYWWSIRFVRRPQRIADGEVQDYRFNQRTLSREAITDLHLF